MHEAISEQGIVAVGVSFVPKKSTAWNRPGTKEFALAGPTYGSIFTDCSLPDLPQVLGAAEGNAFAF